MIRDGHMCVCGIEPTNQPTKQSITLFLFLFLFLSLSLSLSLPDSGKKTPNTHQQNSHLPTGEQTPMNPASSEKTHNGSTRHATAKSKTVRYQTLQETPTRRRTAPGNLHLLTRPSSQSPR